MKSGCTKKTKNKKNKQTKFVYPCLYAMLSARGQLMGSGWSSVAVVVVVLFVVCVADGFGVVYSKCNYVADAVLCIWWH